MILKVIIDDQLYELNVPEELIAKAAEFFDIESSRNTASRASFGSLGERFSLL